MNAVNNQLLAMLVDNGLSPALVEDNGEVMYIGYCAPNCRSVIDKRWYIKRIVTSRTDNTTFQSIELSNGTRKMNVAWADRTELEYKPCEGWEG